MATQLAAVPQASLMALGGRGSAGPGLSITPRLPAILRTGRTHSRLGRSLTVSVVTQQSSRPFVRKAPVKWEPDVLLNEEIRASEVRLIAGDRQMLGVVSRSEALQMAEDSDVDLICIQPEADPPVCRLVDYSKFRYELEKAKKEQSKKQRESKIDIKELKLRPNTDVHDYQVRLRAAEKFLAKGNKVKLSLQFRGREMEFQENGRKTMQKFMQDLGESAAIEAGPSMNGRTMTMTIMAVKKQP